jgi:hypothetical protein
LGNLASFFSRCCSPYRDLSRILLLFANCATHVLFSPQPPPVTMKKPHSKDYDIVGAETYVPLRRSRKSLAILWAPAANSVVQRKRKGPLSQPVIMYHEKNPRQGATKTIECPFVSRVVLSDQARRPDNKGKTMLVLDHIFRSLRGRH